MGEAWDDGSRSYEEQVYELKEQVRDLKEKLKKAEEDAQEMSEKHFNAYQDVCKIYETLKKEWDT